MVPTVDIVSGSTTAANGSWWRDVPTPTFGCPDLYTATTMTTGTTTGSVWPTWTMDTPTTTTTIWARPLGSPPGPFGPSPAEVEAQRARCEEQRLAILAAEALLDSCLSEEQRRNLAHRNFFEVISSKGRLWRIWRGKAWNVRCGSGIWCASPRVDVPDADAMLAQKLWLETDEDAFCSVANAARRVSDEGTSTL